MAQEKISKRQMFKEQGWNFHTYGATGQASGSAEEPLLPTGYSIQENGEVETQNERLKRVHESKPQTQTNKSSSGQEMLLPAGIKLED